jgi:hypothetical protein
MRFDTRSGLQQGAPLVESLGAFSTSDKRDVRTQMKISPIIHYVLFRT